MLLIVLVKWNVFCCNVNFVVILWYFGFFLEFDIVCVIDSFGIVEFGVVDRFDIVLWLSFFVVERCLL